MHEAQALIQTEQGYVDQLQMNNVCYERLNNATQTKEIEKQQVQDKETEAESENLLEQETTNLEYQDLDVVLREEIKQLSMTMENQVVTLSVLEQAHKDIEGENAQIEEYISKLKLKGKQLNESLQQAANEIGNIHQTVQHHGKIIEQLKEFVEMIKKLNNIVQVRTNDFNESAKKMENDVKLWKNAMSTKISDLRDKIAAKKSSIDALDIEENMTNKRTKKRKPERTKSTKPRNPGKIRASQVEISNIEDHSEQLLRAKEKKVATEEKKQLLLNKLDIMRKEYNVKMEEKSNLMAKKYELDKIQLERDFKLRSIRNLDESIEIQNRKIDELDQKIAALEQDDALEKTEKEKAFLEANHQSTARLNPGILKTTQGPKSPVSPKKVTFTGVPSSGSSSDANVSHTTQGAAFDQMLAEFKSRKPQ
nr:unnamed protein product [Callosobruchus analis]